MLPRRCIRRRGVACLLVALASVCVCACGKEAVVETKPLVPGEKYNYAQVINLSIMFYEAQRSGKLPPNNRIPWRGDSALHDGSDVGLDLTGGWFDAGDHVKFVFPQAWTVTALAWGVLEYWDGYQASGELDWMLDCLKWPLDFLIKAHSSPEELYYQIGDGGSDHNYWGPPEYMTMARPSMKLSNAFPGSEVAGQTAAAMAAGYLVFKDHDNVYAESLLSHAKDLFEFGDKYRGTGSTQFYGSSGYTDELAWAATWLYMATADHKYLDYAEMMYPECCSVAVAKDNEGKPQVYNWDNQASGVTMLLYHLTQKPVYAQDFHDYMDTWFARPVTPKGLTYYSEWGTNRYTANTAFLALLAGDYGLDPNRVYAKWGRQQIHYILGDCCGGVDPKTNLPFYSYLIGYGNDYPKAPHHRSSSCDGPGHCDCSTRPHPHLLYGGLVGGPTPKDQYTDTCADYVHNEVAVDYNAALTSAAAALKHLSITGQLNNF